MKLLVLALLLLVPSLSVAQGFETPLIPAKRGNDYAAIEFMSAGASKPLSTAAQSEDLPAGVPQDPAPRGLSLRDLSVPRNRDRDNWP
jgi:hypothetical protein